MPRNLLGTRPRAKYGIHRFRNLCFRYNGQTVPGLYIVIDLRRLGLKTPAILKYFERLERSHVRQTLLTMPCLTEVVH